MILVHSKLLAFLLAFCVVVALSYSWDYLTEAPRHRKLKVPTQGNIGDIGDIGGEWDDRVG